MSAAANAEAGILVVAMMACVFSSAVSGALTYTCTKGTFEFDQFDADHCFAIPEDEGSSGSGGGGGEGGGVDTFGSSYAAAGEDLLVCFSAFFSDESRTCFTDTSQIGVRWAWLNSDLASSCREKVAKYFIEVSSSSDNHNKKYGYSIVGKDANSIIISDASAVMVDGDNKQNVRLYITPLDASGAKITDTATAEVDVGSSATETCDAIGGTAVAFSEFTELATTVAESGTPCTGGTWSEPGPCMADDGITEITGEPGACGAGTALTVLTGYTGGPPCVTEKRERCAKECAEPTPTDCVLARLPNGEINWNPYPGTPDYNATCLSQCAASGAANESIFASADVLEDAQGNGQCAYTQTTTCECPRDCVGSWQHSHNEERQCKDDTSENATYKVEKFVVSTPANATGSCPDANKVRKTRTDFRFRIKNWYEGWKDIDIEVDGMRYKSTSSSGIWKDIPSSCPVSE